MNILTQLESGVKSAAEVKDRFDEFAKFLEKRKSECQSDGYSEHVNNMLRLEVEHIEAMFKLLILNC